MKKYIFPIESMIYFCLISCNINKADKTKDDTDNKFIVGAYADSIKVASTEPLSEYDDIVEFIRKGFVDKWQTTSPEDIGVSYIYQYCSPSMGFAKIDINEDGTPELLLGDSMNDSYAIYDIFSYNPKVGKTKHIFCGGERDRCVFNTEGLICREGSNSASDSFTKYYQLKGNEMVELKDAVVKEDLKLIQLEPFKKRQ